MEILILKMNIKVEKNETGAIRLEMFDSILMIFSEF